MSYTALVYWDGIKWPNVAEPPPTRGVNRDSGTDSANGSGDLLGGESVITQIAPTNKS